MTRLLAATDRGQLEVARRVSVLSDQMWGRDHAMPLIGRHPVLAEALERVVRAAGASAPVLVTGESGTGKELFARALFLLASSHRRTLIPINCGQFVNDQVVVSELFGHTKGSFTGAVRDHGGVFQEADGGTVFLDEIGELPPPAQAILLRVLDTGEVLPLGATRPRRVSVRVIAATNRDLRGMVEEGTFRVDLYFRLRRLSIRIPPLRDRGRDWELIAEHFLNALCEHDRTSKRLTIETVSKLDAYPWPGNVREVRGCVETGFYMSNGPDINYADLIEALEATTRGQQWERVGGFGAAQCCAQMEGGEGDFWDLVHGPFMARDLNRDQVRNVIVEGLARSRGGYKGLLPAFGIEGSDYLRFMDFLRHHDLKPPRQHRLRTDTKVG